LGNRIGSLQIAFATLAFRFAFQSPSKYTSRMDKPVIYICIEIKNREYVSQIFLSLKAALKGYRVYLGTHAAIYSLLRTKKTRTGIFLDKSLQPESRMKSVLKSVEYFCVLDAELSPYFTEEYWMEEIPGRIYPNSDELVDKFLVVNEEIAKVAAFHFTEQKSKVVVTGWPRIELWRGLNSEIYSHEVLKIQEKYGKFLLFASNFGNLQNPIDTESISAVPPKTTKESNLESQIQNYKNFKEAIKMIRKWDADPSMPTIIIRPHPSERISIWRKELKKTKKTFVVRGGPISPWVLASNGVIQHRSTVSIEAFLSGKPVFALVLSEKQQNYQNGWFLSKYLLDKNTKNIGRNFEGVELNPDHDPEIVKSLLPDFEVSSTDSILKLFDQLLSKSEKRHSSIKLILGKVQLISLRRGLGLVRDEIYWFLRKTNINPQSHFVPRGLDVKTIKMIAQADTEFRGVRFKRISINLWMFEY
jgi:surface carbohydrate biosynthesis protein